MRIIGFALASCFLAVPSTLYGSDCDCSHFPWDPDPPCVTTCGSQLIASVTKYELIAFLNISENLAAKLKKEDPISEKLELLERPEIHRALKELPPYQAQYLLSSGNRERENVLDRLAEKDKEAVSRLASNADRLKVLDMVVSEAFVASGFFAVHESSEFVATAGDESSRVSFDMTGDGLVVTIHGSVESAKLKAALGDAVITALANIDLNEVAVTNEVEVIGSGPRGI